MSSDGEFGEVSFLISRSLPDSNGLVSILKSGEKASCQHSYRLKTFGHSLQIILFIQACDIPDHLLSRNAHYLVCHKGILALVWLYYIGLEAKNLVKSNWVIVILFFGEPDENRWPQRFMLLDQVFTPVSELSAHQIS